MYFFVFLHHVNVVVQQRLLFACCITYCCVVLWCGVGFVCFRAVQSLLPCSQVYSEIISRCILAQSAGEPPLLLFPLYFYLHGLFSTQKPRAFTWAFNKKLRSCWLLFFYRKLLKLAGAETEVIQPCFKKKIVYRLR